MTCFYLIASADYPAVGRPDKASFSDQTLMELFLGETEVKRGFKDSDGNFKPIHQWPGIEFFWDDMTNKSMGVSKVEFHSVSNKAQFQLEWLPETVYSLEIECNAFAQTIDWKVLPAGLHMLNADDNRLTGTLPFEDFPPDIWAVVLSNNDFFGTLDFSKVPESLELLVISHNDFSGSISFVMITRPLRKCGDSRLDFMYEENEKPEGEPVFDIELDMNAFENDILVYDIGICDESMIPKGMRIIDRNGNTLSGRK